MPTFTQVRPLNRLDHRQAEEVFRMSLEDLRIAAHELSKGIHELDVDRQEEQDRRATVDAEFAARDAVLSGRAHDLATALQNYQPTQPPVPPKPLSPVEYGLYCYNDPEIDARWTSQTLQGQPETVKRLPALRTAGVRKLYRYTHALTRTANDRGIRQAYSVFKDTWLARDRNGQPIASSKFWSGEDPNYLIDLGLPEYQQHSAEYLVGKCRAEGWDGIYLDEINEYQSYAGYRLPANYSTEYRFQLAQLAYIQHVSTALRNAGFECHVNIASNDNQWRKNVMATVDGSHVEFGFVQWTVNSPDAWHVASLENGQFLQQLGWLAWNEVAGKVTTCQADAKTAAEVDYALASLLLVATGKARFAARKNQSYGVGQGWWTPAMDTARLLGQPKGAYTVASGLYQRSFEHGRVTVNPNGRTVGTMPATSGLIELR
jgi:hypothetical protein